MPSDSPTPPQGMGLQAAVREGGRHHAGRPGAGGAPRRTRHHDSPGAGEPPHHHDVPLSCNIVTTSSLGPKVSMC